LNTFKVSLLEEHKSERRKRIQRAARKLVIECGYEGLTMRDLAEAARVSVPTLYNLFGSKDAILVAELEAVNAEIAANLAPLPATATFFERGAMAFDTGHHLIEQSPEFFRAVARMFLTSPESSEMRQRVDDGFVALMRGNLAAAKAAGQLADWADPHTIACHGYVMYTATFLRWALREIDLDELRAINRSAMLHLLAGCARGAYAEDVEAALRSLPPLVIAPKEVADARSRD
jgi:AcrR family transcriptional regulator